jgi:hypothetical protein
MSSDEFISSLFAQQAAEYDESIPFEFGGGYSEFDTISPEDVLITSYQNEPVFRCSTLLAPAPAPEAFEAHLDLPVDSIVERPSLKRHTSKNSYSISEASSYLDYKVQSCGGIIVPEIPLLLMPTHFEVEMDIGSIMIKVNEILNSVAGVSYETKKETFEVSNLRFLRAFVM